MSLNPERVPVVVGVGEAVDRTRDPVEGREPLALMIDALGAAQADAGAALLDRLDALDVICEYSWPYVDAPGLVSQRLGVVPRHSRYGDVGGESPVRYLHEAALRIQRGESSVAAIVGAEAQYTVAGALKANIDLPWHERNKKAVILTGREFSAPVAVDHGVCIPTHVYPLYENASSAHYGQTQREALRESGETWAALSRAAAKNPAAWLREAYSPEAIVTPGDRNRLIAWPYTKHMVANPLVNQGAALLLTSAANARALGIPESRWVSILGGAAANEPRDYLERDHYWESHAQNAVLERCVQIAGGDARRFGAMELYSCFPCVPKMARRTLGLPASASLSVTGGLSFFGAPLNDYMTHAAAAIVRALREQPAGTLGLLYGQGEFVTKHHALVMTRGAASADAIPEDYRVQEAADACRGPVPEFRADYEGPATVETFTVVYGRDGSPEYGCVIGRTPADERIMARVPPTDTATLARLTDLDSHPVGTAGAVGRLDAKRLGWTAA